MAESLMQVNGLISGLSTSDIIQSMMSLERRSLANMEARKTKLQERADAIREINTRLSALKTALGKLMMASVMNAKAATPDTATGAPQVLSATATADAALGSFQVTVERLATATFAKSTAALSLPVNETAVLAEAGFALTPTTGYFSVNGVTIQVDADDKLNDPADQANSIVHKINSAGAGVTASVADNKLRLTSDSPIQLGSGGDTSNFLTATKLIAAPQTGTGPYIVESTGSLGVTKTGDYLSSARLATALAATGTFKINGKEFTYDASVDSLNGVLSRINTSDAGVIASYDSMSDRLVITAKATGSTTIALEDTAGNFLTALQVMGGAAQTLGQTARYKVDTVNGGDWLYSASNTVVGVVPGVTLNLKGTSASPVTVTVSQDATKAVAALNDFVTQFNNVLSFIEEKTAYDATKKSGAILAGDPAALGIQSRLRQLITGTVYGLSGGISSFASVGLSTGAIGSAVGSTNTLKLDEEKFTAALTSNPTSVFRLFGSAAGTMQLQAGGTGSIARVSGCPNEATQGGTYTITSDGLGNLTAVFTPTGGVAGAEIKGTITAGGTNSTLIPGVTLTAKSVLSAGTDTIALTLDGGIAARLLVHVNTMIKADGVLDGGKDTAEKEIRRLTKRISDAEERLSDKEARLQRQFAALEAAMSRLQGQSSYLAAQVAQMNRQT